MMMRLTTGIVLMAATAVIASATSIYQYTDTCLTDNSGVCNSLLDTLHLTEQDGTFTLSNDGDGVVEGIWFETTAQFLSVVTSNGVAFTVGGTPHDPPAGNTVSFFTNFYATAVSPAPSNGVGNGEWLRIVTNGGGGNEPDTTTRVAVHVIAFQGTSETVMFAGTSVPTTVPEPGSTAIVGAALILVGLMRKRVQ